YFALYIVTHVDEDARKRALQQLEDEAEGRGGKAGQALNELEDQLRADSHRRRDELNEALATTKADLETQRTNRTEEIVAAAQATEAKIGALGSGAAAETIVFEPTGEVVVAEGDKAGKEATSRLQKIVRAETERVNDELKQREADEARATEEKVAALEAAIGDTLSAERDRLSSKAQGLK